MGCKHLSWAFISAASAALVFAACTGETGDDDGNETPAVDASSSETDDPDATPSEPKPDAEPQQELTCEDPVAGVDGNHNAGLDCLGCHQTASGNRPKFTIAGTLYSDKEGSGRVARATITVEDADGKILKLVTADTTAGQGRGNFYTGESVTFPIKVHASKCPSDPIAMQGEVSASGGDCNQAGCHSSSGNRIFLTQP